MSGENPVVPPEERDLLAEKVEMKIKEWLQALVFLASGSGKRIEGLVRVGFDPEKITPCPVPDEIETAAIDSYDRIMTDPRGSGITSEVARVKVGYVLRNSGLQIPSGAFIIGADTMPIKYQRIHEPSQEQPPSNFYWLAESMRKPKSKEEARRMILELFSRIAENYKEGLNSDLDIGVKVKTSVSVRFPHEDRIQTEAYAVVLIPRRILSVIDSRTEEINSELEKITDEVLEVMEEEGVDVTKVRHHQQAGGLMSGVASKAIVTLAGF
ncbi:MAG: Maf family protein [Candidatus Uhrbacteria bacterium]